MVRRVLALWLDEVIHLMYPQGHPNGHVFEAWRRRGDELADAGHVEGAAAKSGAENRTNFQ